MNGSTGERFGDWFLTFTGRQFYPLDPRPEDVCIEDIAHALSNLCRFGGHSRFFYSVAQHSVLVSHIVPHDVAFIGLLHDSTEAYCMDLVRPLKHSLPNYIAIEDNIWSVICDHFEIDRDLLLRVKDADNIALVTERRDVLTPAGPEWDLMRRYSPIPTQIAPVGPVESEHRFLERFHELHT